MTRLVILTLAVLLTASPAAACSFKFCKDRASVSTPTRSYITNARRQRVGDLYDPGHGRRIQIRDNHRRILEYIERSGRITNPSRQRVGSIEALR